MLGVAKCEHLLAKYTAFVYDQNFHIPVLLCRFKTFPKMLLKKDFFSSGSFQSKNEPELNFFLFCGRPIEIFNVFIRTLANLFRDKSTKNIKLSQAQK